MSTYSISVTGLQLKGILSFAKFRWVVGPASEAARKFEGNVHVSTNSFMMPNDKGEICRTMMTITAWESREATRKYVASPEHRAASSLTKEICSFAKTYHYESDAIPSWDEAKELWIANGKVYPLPGNE